MTEAQKKQQIAILEDRRRQDAADNSGAALSKKANASKEALAWRDAYWNELESLVEQNLTQSQRDRLNQIQLQVQNAMAFERADPEAARLNAIAGRRDQEDCRSVTKRDHPGVGGSRRCESRRRRRFAVNR